MYIDKVKTYKVGEYSFVNFLQLDDETIESIRLWRNHPDIRKVMYNTDEITPEQHSKFISSLSESTSKYYWLVYKTGQPVGVMNIIDVNNLEETGQLGYYLLPQYLNSGIGLEFISTIINFIFSELGLSSLFGRTELSNKDALRFNYCLGFNIRPEIVLINGVKYVEQDCDSKEFQSRYNRLTDVRSFVTTMKEFNKIYDTNLLTK